MGLVSGLSLANHFDSKVLPGGARLAQPRWMPVRRLLGAGRMCGVSFWHFLNSSGWWWLISSMFLTRTSCRKIAHADGYYGTWPGWAVSVSVLPLTVFLIFLKRSLVFPILLFSFISLHWSLRQAFLSLLAILWNSSFRWVYLSFPPSLLASLLFSAIDPEFPFFLAESSFSLNFLDLPTMPTLLALSALRRDVPGSPGQAFLLLASVWIGSVEAREVGSGLWSDCLCLNPPWTHSLCDIGQITSSFWVSFSSFTRSE